MRGRPGGFDDIGNPATEGPGGPVSGVGVGQLPGAVRAYAMGLAGRISTRHDDSPRVRVICSGDRGWSDEQCVQLALERLPWDRSRIQVVQGGCRKGSKLSGGADEMADRQARSLGMPDPEEHVADWRRWGRAAGPHRNQDMVNAGADLLLAFHRHLAVSRGTLDMVKRAGKAGIPTIILCGAGDALLLHLTAGSCQSYFCSERDLDEDGFCARHGIVRAGGDVDCARCGRCLIDHPLALEARYQGIDGPFLHWHCDGRLVKL